MFPHPQINPHVFQAAQSPTCRSTPLKEKGDSARLEESKKMTAKVEDLNFLLRNQKPNLQRSWRFACLGGKEINLSLKHLQDWCGKEYGLVLMFKGFYRSTTSSTDGIHTFQIKEFGIMAFFQRISTYLSKNSPGGLYLSLSPVHHEKNHQFPVANPIMIFKLATGWYIAWN